jgi:hypothetical protein
MSEETDLTNFIKDIGKIVEGFSDLADIALLEYQLFTNDVLSGRFKDINKIEYKLDLMLDFCFDNRILSLYKIVLRHIYYKHQDTVKFYVDAYIDRYGAITPAACGELPSALQHPVSGLQAVFFAKPTSCGFALVGAASLAPTKAAKKFQFPNAPEEFV